MKKIIVLGFLFISSISPLKAQIYTPSGTIQGASGNNNVGIGTTNPLSKINSFKGVQSDNVILTNSTAYLQGNDIGVMFGQYLSSPYGSWMQSVRTDDTAFPLSINPNGGNVGIGTITPGYKLDLNTSPANAESYSGINLQSGNYGYLIEGGVKQNVGGILKFSSNTAGVKSEKFRIDSNGNVGIGSTTPDQKLTVKGKIHAEEIIVDLRVPADYVFQKYYTGKSDLKSDYTMPTLAEIEDFTKTNHHLPNVPSAQEVQQYGVSLGQMSNVLLQKVEELTLYAIEQNKELERLKAENANYKLLSERLSAIEKELKK